MSRIGKQPIAVPGSVDVTIADGRVTAKGPNGELSLKIVGEVTVVREGDELIVARANDERRNRALHGLQRTLVANLVKGVSEGFTRELDIVGVGYRAAAQGSDALEIAAGYSHPVHFKAPAGITFEVPAPTKIIVKGADKQLVGQVAADIRKVRKPEPYKGKGIRYSDEIVRRKAGKSAK
jgi:large subunit ribosomal protein L6